MLCYFPLSGSGRIILDYIKKSFQKTPKYSEGELENISAALANAIKMVLGLAAYGFFYGLIAALYNLSDISRLGPIVAISLLSSFYSITLCVFVFFPTKVWADLKLKEKTKGGGIKRGGEDNESETF
jgi:flagellar motor component MotA